jgi:cAMP-specific phosphodiesterase 4
MITQFLFKDESIRSKFSQETLDEIDWCLTQLEHMQSHKTISDIASTKFKRMLNKELSHFAEQNKSDNQIAEYICNTYLGKIKKQRIKVR